MITEELFKEIAMDMSYKNAVKINGDLVRQRKYSEFLLGDCQYEEILLSGGSSLCLEKKDHRIAIYLRNDDNDQCTRKYIVTPTPTYFKELVNCLGRLHEAEEQYRESMRNHHAVKAVEI